MSLLPRRARALLGALALCAPTLVPDSAAGQATRSDATALRSAVQRYRTTHEGAILREFAELLAIPNVASDRANIHRNADALVTMLRRRGVAARLLTVDDAPPVVYGEITVPGAARTIILYAHYDGQPVDPAPWATPPWTPPLRTRARSDGGAGGPDRG